MSDYGSQNNLEALEQYERREERAYAMFQRQYQRQYPQPDKPKVYRQLSGMAWIFGLIALAGSLLAAERTVSVFVEIADLTAETWIAYIVGGLALIVVDVGAISFRFARIYLTYRYQDNPPPITSWVARGAAFALGTQLIAQLYGVRGIVDWLPGEVIDVMQLGIALAAALSGMVLAFVTGEILAVLSLQAQHDNRAERTLYDADMMLWRQGLTEAWDVRKGRYVGPVPRADKRSPLITDKPPIRRHRQDRPPSPKVAQALRWLEENPDHEGLTVRELERLSGVNRDAADKALRLYRQNVSARVSASNNGHSHGNGER